MAQPRLSALEAWNSAVKLLIGAANALAGLLDAIHHITSGEGLLPARFQH